MCFSLFFLICVHIICLVMYLPPMTNRVYQVVQSVHFILFIYFFFIEVAHRIHGRREGKLLPCSRKDTGCRNQSTLMRICQYLEFPCSYFSGICNMTSSLDQLTIKSFETFQRCILCSLITLH